MNLKQPSSVGIVLGAVFVIMGFARSNAGIWILGGILLAFGLWLRIAKKN